MQPKQISSEASENLGQEAVAAYQERYKRHYGTWAQLLQGDGNALKDARKNLGEVRFFTALDTFFACNGEQAKRRKHPVKMFVGEINVWLDPEAAATSFPLARAAPPGRNGISPEDRAARNLAAVTGGRQ
jgi:hypothetical protein